MYGNELFIFCLFVPSPMKYDYCCWNLISITTSNFLIIIVSKTTLTLNIDNCITTYLNLQTSYQCAIFVHLLIFFFIATEYCLFVFVSMLQFPDCLCCVDISVGILHLTLQRQYLRWPNNNSVLLLTWLKIKRRRKRSAYDVFLE